MIKKLDHILYVDDEAHIQEVAQLCLEMMADFQVTCLSSGAELVEKAAAIQPDLILLDVMMPMMDGPTTLQKLRENPAMDAIPVIFMTARAQPEEVRQYKQMGAAGVIAKPFDPMTLATEITEIWNSVNGMDR